jgi:hypothetical protein
MTKSSEIILRMITTLATSQNWQKKKKKHWVVLNPQEKKTYDGGSVEF